jgi:penicillin-binding protein 2
VVRLQKSVEHLRPEEVPYHQRDHAWFVGFAPVEDPEIVVVALTEHGGFGGTASAPVAVSVIRTWAMAAGLASSGPGTPLDAGTP